MVDDLRVDSAALSSFHPFGRWPATGFPSLGCLIEALAWFHACLAPR